LDPNSDGCVHHPEWPMSKRANHSFIIRIMVEPGEQSGAHVEWKGMVQYVTSGERRYFRNINDIPMLIQRILHLAPEANKDGSSPGNRRDLIHSG
jgi:hypothetical protein